MIRKPDFNQTHEDIMSWVRSHADERGYCGTVRAGVDSLLAVMYKSECDTDIHEYVIAGLRTVGDCLEMCICGFLSLDEDDADVYMDTAPWIAVDGNPEVLYAQTLFNIANGIESYGKEND